MAFAIARKRHIRQEKPPSSRTINGHTFAIPHTTYTVTVVPTCQYFDLRNRILEDIVLQGAVCVREPP